MSRSQLTFLRVGLVVWWVAMSIGTHWPRLNLEPMVGIDQYALPFGLDKWVHFGAFGGLAFLFLSSHLLKGSVLRQAGLAMVGLVVWAGIDELTQYFVPGRGVHWGDWFASSLGIAGGVASWAGLRWLILSHDNSFISHTRVVSGMTVLSRVFGLVRDWALARVFGFGVVMDAFIIAFMVPNLFRRLFGEGALAAAFIPHYSRLREREARAATRFALLVVDVLTTGLVGLAMLGALAMGALAFYGGLDPRGTLTAGLTAVTVWYMPLVCITAILGAVLQVHGRFAVPAATPVILNLFVIAAALGGGMLLGNEFTSQQTVFLVAGSIVLAGIVQVVWQVVALRQAGVHLRESRQHDHGERWGGPLVKEAGGGLLKQWVPTVLGLAIFQLNALADALIALFFSGPAGAEILVFGRSVTYPMEQGSVGVIGMAQRLYEFPLGVFGIAVATAIFPALSAAAAAKPEVFGRLLRQGLRLTIFIALPAGVGLLLVREPLAGTIFHEGGELQPGDASRVAWVLSGYALAVWAFSMNQILVRAFYAQHDAKTPMRVGLWLVGLNVVLNFTLIWPLGAVGLAWSTSVCAVLQSVILLLLLRRYVAGPVDRSVWAGWGRTALLTVTMGVAVWLAIGGIDLAGQPWAIVAGTLLLGTGVGATVFGGGAVMLRMTELKWLLGRGVREEGD